MKINLKRLVLSLILLLVLSPVGRSMDSLKYSISMNYYKDLSDTYGGGYLYAGEFGLTNSWYGACISFGHFQSHTIFNYSISIEEISKSINIPFDEVTIMKTGSLSAKLIPIQTRLLTTELLFGLSFGSAKNSRFNSVDYSYSLINNKFNYLYKDYKLVKRNHFGYQVGINISLLITKKFGLQVNSRMQDLNNSGTFFFVGGGLCFRL